MSNTQSRVTIENLEEVLKKIDDLHWKTQDSHNKSLLFYKFNRDDEQEHQLFAERIKDAQFYMCITNSKNLELESEKIICLNDSEYNEFFLKSTEALYPVDQGLFHLLGVTGTNGKTTVVDLIRQISIQNNIKVLTVGTLGVYLNDKKIEDFPLTSPSTLDLYKIIHRYHNEIDIVALEVSSHALVQNRLGNLKLSKGAWTNFTQDHLDYHGTMEKYFSAKLKIFDLVENESDVFFVKDEKVLCEKTNKKASVIEVLESTENLFLKPTYNKQNISLAKALVSSVYPDIKVNLREISPPPGRFNIFEFKESFIVVDFAHTPDAIDSISKELKKTFPNHKLSIVFGCGGDRDKSKRPLMGKAASVSADKLYLTSDNPRFENPDKIIEDIIEGVDIPYIVEVNRSKAIEIAINELDKHVLLIAGKGHEAYIDKDGLKMPYSDEAEVRKHIND